MVWPILPIEPVLIWPIRVSREEKGEIDMKRAYAIIAFVVVLAVAAQALLAQTESATPKDQTKAPAKEKMAGTKADDSMFLNEAASGGLLEVRLGSFIQQSATDDSVKAFGQQMVTDHSKLNDELKALAQAKAIVLPAGMNKRHMDAYNGLSKKTGADLDKSYMNLMVKEHNKDIAEFRKMAKNATDADVRAFASNALPVLEKHLAMAKAVDKMLTGMGEAKGMGQKAPNGEKSTGTSGTM